MTIDEGDRVRLAPGVMLRHDRNRGEWMLMAPERVLTLDDTALAVLRVCTGPDAPTVGGAIDALAADYDAPRAEIGADVLELLADLRLKGYIAS